MISLTSLFTYLALFFSLMPLAITASIGIAKRSCTCPIDAFGETGVLINTFPYFECAYQAGTCDWNFNNGELENTAQTNCPPSAECANLDDCQCPLDDLNGTGAFINVGTAIQCAYGMGACTFNTFGANMNAIGQSNCAVTAPCS